MDAAPELSDLAEKHVGKVAIVGINNEAMFPPADRDLEKVKEFLESKKEEFRYTVYVDTPEGHARDSKLVICFPLFASMGRHRLSFRNTEADFALQRNRFHNLDISAPASFGLHG